jgi:hypothetical protein
MTRISAVLALVCIAVSAQAVQTVELKDYPELKPLNWCKHADGVTRGHIEPCGPDTTVGTSISTAQIGQKKEATDASSELNANTAAQDATPALSTATEEPAASDKGMLKQGRQSWLKLLGFALVVGIVAKLLGRSFLRWFSVGIIAHITLVSLNVLSF